MAQFVAPARVWFGQMSDAKPLFGYHRTGYVWTGAVLFAIASFLAVQVIWQLGFSLQAGWTTQTLAGLRSWQWFSGSGLAISASSTPLRRCWWMFPMKITAQNWWELSGQC